MEFFLLDYCLYDFSFSDLYFPDSRLLVFVETETYHKACLQAVIVEVFNQLLLATFVVGVASPYFQFYDILLIQIVNYNVGSGKVAGLSLAIIIAHAVNYRAQIR